MIWWTDSNRSLPPFDSGEHAFWVGGPDEAFGIEVCLGDEAVDGGLQSNDRSEHAALEALAGELGEEAFDSLSPAVDRSSGFLLPVAVRAPGPQPLHGVGRQRLFAG